MRAAHTIVLVIFVAVWIGCAIKSSPILLSAPPASSATAGSHNDEGMKAYYSDKMDEARQHFETAINEDPDLAEAHYNLGMTLYRLGKVGDGDQHFIRAANLAPGNKIIWNAPPLRNAAPSEKDLIPTASDGHMHSH
jgi:tetratricopeptide (TPR) repeat protein